MVFIGIRGFQFESFFKCSINKLHIQYFRLELGLGQGQVRSGLGKGQGQLRECFKSTKNPKQRWVQQLVHNKLRMQDSYTNPSEMKRIGFVDLTKRIHETNLWKTGLQNEATIRIFKVRIRESGFASAPAWIRKDSFHAIVLRICKDS